MALQLSAYANTGAMGNYWKITSLEINSLENTVRCEISLYVDSQARTDDMQPMAKKRYFWIGEDNPCTPADMETASPLTLCYAHIKSLEEFDGAIDV